jgi:hypothetical protein
VNDPKREAAALRRLADFIDDDLLRDEYPIELVDEELRAQGMDPEEIGRRGEAFVRDLLEKKRNEMHAEALAKVAPLEARARAARAKAPRSRASMLARIHRAERDPRFAGQVAVAFRGRKPEEPSDEELAAIVAKLEALGVLSADDDDGSNESGAK